MIRTVIPRVSHVARPVVAATPVGMELRCHLNLHEYQSKELMDSFGVVTQKGAKAVSSDDAMSVAKWIQEDNPSAEFVVKAQIHAGGRGKGTFTDGFQGGVKICTEVDAVGEMSGKMLNNTLVTKQTGPDGQLCSTVLINEGLDIQRELYFAILMDRAFNGPVIVASTEGGMDIEEVAEATPDAIVKVPIDIYEGVTDADAALLCSKLGFEGETATKATAQFRSLFDMFLSTDATQVEINPLAVADVAGVGAKGLVVAVDAKLGFDDNAEYRQKDIFALRDRSLEDPRDVAAEDAGVNYIGLDGTIGCMVNGAGLAMATMDTIKMKGGEPANFLDLGGGATKDQVVDAFRIVTSDHRVKAILVNIFGGIVFCDVIAQGIVDAVKQVGLDIPLVVRLEGTNVEAGKKIIADSGLTINTADDLDDAATKVVASI